MPVKNSPKEFLNRPFVDPKVICLMKGPVNERAGGGLGGVSGGSGSGAMCRGGAVPLLGK